MVLELLLLKLIVAVGVVVGLTLITEESALNSQASRRAPDRLCDFALFIGMDNGTAFASSTAITT